MINKQFFKDLVADLDAKHVTLVAVSKTHPAERILELYAMGQRVFGENRVQELLSKQPGLPPDIRWHLIGHLQTNKVRQSICVVSMIESVDSIKLLRTIQKEAASAGLTVEILLQIKIAREETKYGFDPVTVEQELRDAGIDKMTAIRFRGVMGMASFVDDDAQVRSEFRALKSCFDELRKGLFQDNPDFDQISMGMSGDYEIAIREGSTMVRIGSLIFGERA